MELLINKCELQCEIQYDVQCEIKGILNAQTVYFLYVKQLEITQSVQFQILEMKICV